MGTWKIGENSATHAEEIATLQRGIELGMTLIDTAEMYGEGAAERLIGKAIRGRRDKVFLVSKFYPDNASVRGAQLACERSLERLGVDCLDLYLLHWRGSIPLQETLEAMKKLQLQGKIRYWGVSNLDTGDLQELYALPGGEQSAVNQVLYNLSRRSIEWDLLPWCEARRIAVMAYSPIEQARLLHHQGLLHLAGKLNMTPAQVALAWLLGHDQIIVIPKATTLAHLEENFAALQCILNPCDLAELNRLFPPPRRAKPLEIL